jgi:hypothetical protein
MRAHLPGVSGVQPPAATTGADLGGDLGELSDDELINAMTAARRQASQAQAAELAAVAELARRRIAETVDPNTVEVISPQDYLRDEVSCALTLTARSAADLIDFATTLIRRLPGTLAALSNGDIDYCKALSVWHGTQLVDNALTARIEAAVLPRAAQQTTGEIRAKIRRLIKKLDPDAFERRRHEAEKQRRVELIEDEAGTAHLSGCDLPADAAASAYDRIDAIAAAVKAAGDTRGIDRLRADVFLGLLHGTHDFPEPSVTVRQGLQGERAWTELDDLTAAAIAQATRDELERVTGRLPDRHRDLAALLQRAGERISTSLADLKAHWCMTGHTAGETADENADGHGAAGYRPPAAMRRIIEERDGRCRYPGCRRPARRADIDHTIPHQRGGPTCPCNLSALCRRHHKLKQTKGWKLQQLWPGVFLWITPTGHWHIVTPVDRE